MQEQQSPSFLRPLLKLFKVSTVEDLIKRLVKTVFTLLLVVPLILVPLYFFFFTLLHL